MCTGKTIDFTMIRSSPRIYLNRISNWQSTIKRKKRGKINHHPGFIYWVHTLYFTCNFVLFFKNIN